VPVANFLSAGVVAGNFLRPASKSQFAVPKPNADQAGKYFV
jgi:hypothetical protein